MRSTAATFPTVLKLAISLIRAAVDNDHQRLVAAATSLPAVRNSGRQQQPKILWVSEPVEPGRFVMVHTAGNVLANGSHSGAEVSCTPWATGSSSLRHTTQIHSVILEQSSSSSCKFIYPMNAKGSCQLSLTIAGLRSPPYQLNAARVWWLQGDEGNQSSVGGWVRAFGHNLWSVDRKGPIPMLRLQREGLPSVDISAALYNASAYSAHFVLPEQLSSGIYSAWVRGYVASWTRVQFFASPMHPNVTTITVLPSAPSRFSTKIFRVRTNESFDYISNSALNATEAVHAALRGAANVVKIAGASTTTTIAAVQIEEGGFWVDGALQVSHSTTLVGDGVDRTALYFIEDDQQTAPEAYISCDRCIGTPWGLRDVTVYVTGFYHAVIRVGPQSNGVRISRVRVRANPNINLDPDYRKPRWTYNELGTALILQGTNFAIMDCDIYSVGYGVATDADGSDWLAPESREDYRPSYGSLSRSTIKSGNNRIMLDGAAQIIIEDNVFGGAGSMAGGVGLATYGRTAYMAHVFYANNTNVDTYGMDREAMTFDQAGWTSSTYLGPASKLSANGMSVTIPPSTEPGRARGAAPNYKLPTNGGYLVVLNGSSEGTWRRIVASRGISDESTVFDLDQPLTAALSTESWLQIATFKGRCIFFRNHFADAGPFDLWGHAIENIVAENTASRIYGMYGTGMFEPWQPPDKNPSASQLPQPGSMLMNLHNVFVRNNIRDANDIPHRLFSCQHLSNDSDCHHLPSKFSSPNQRRKLAIVGQVGCLSSCGNLSGLSPPSRFTVMRDNIVHGRGGVLVDGPPPSHGVDDSGHSYGCPGGIADVLMEGNQQVLRNSPGPGEGFYVRSYPGTNLSRDSILLHNNSVVVQS